MASSLILASRSPRRLEALTALGLRYDAIPSGVEDVMAPPEDPCDPVPIATAKAQDIAQQRPDAVVLAGDTVVALGDQALGKPLDAADAAAMLAQLRGKPHAVRSGVALISEGALEQAEVACPLRMRDYSDQEIHHYVATGEPMDCAGAYDVHKLGGQLVDVVQGCFSTVVGLPIVQAAAMLRRAGVVVPSDPARMCSDLYGRPCLALRPATAGACFAK